MAKHSNGLYWLYSFHDEEWTIAEYDDNWESWTLLGTDETFKALGDNWFIGKKIERPQSTVFKTNTANFPQSIKNNSDGCNHKRLILHFNNETFYCADCGEKLEVKLCHDIIKNPH